MTNQRTASGDDDVREETPASLASPRSSQGTHSTPEQVRERSLRHQAMMRAAFGDSVMTKIGNDGWR